METLIRAPYSQLKPVCQEAFTGASIPAVAVRVPL